MIEVFRDSVMITCFVLVIMLIIEYINVRTGGRWSNFLKRSRLLQILFAGLIGVTPGCLGSYAIVSLYTHGILNFSSLTTAMVATFGDEALVIFSQRPDIAIKLASILLAVGIFSGLLIWFVFKNKISISSDNFHLTLHHVHDDHDHYSGASILHQFRKITFQRAILLFGLLIFLFGLITGQFAEDHGVFSSGTVDWIKITSVAGSAAALIIVCIVPDHFLEEHLWGHIIKKHFLKIFLWTLGALLVVHFFLDNVELQKWIITNPFPVLLLALAIGIIPESGPHLIFFFMFTSGNLPFSVLVANSIVQDGHGALPLLAESKKSFFVLKTLKFIIGFVVGISGYFLGW